MDAKLSQLVDTAWARFQQWPENKRICEFAEIIGNFYSYSQGSNTIFSTVIAIGGIPGSGKLTT